MTTLDSQTNILKKVYEKGKPVDQNKQPPFMKGRKAPNEEVRKQKSEAAQRRLAMMQKKQPKGK